MKDTRHKGPPGRRLVSEGGTLNTRPKGRQHPHVLAPESPRRPEIAEEIRQGVRTSKGKPRAPQSGGMPRLF